MDIYLVKIVESTGSPCIVRKPDATTNDEYTAISHVWGDPQTIQRTSVVGAGEVDLSPSKRDILSILRRPDICGHGWFWMDLFCINQSEGASISIQDQLKAIPAIYKSSKCVKVLIESPVCDSWYTTAVQTQTYGQWSSAAWKKADTKEAKEFLAWELHHSRRCTGMLFLDLWFDRLWTRQEGLYAVKLDMIVLNPVACLRFSSSKVQTPQQKWTIEGDVSLKRDKMFTFIEDKIKYHGLPREDGYRYSMFFDMVYTRHLDIQKYHGDAGPALSYSPIDEAWRSNRKTTKARDYVLAIFPDFEGYKPPANARTMTFPELLIDALNQIQRPGTKRRIVIKVNAGIVKPHVGANLRPFILDKPKDIGEAFDTFTTLVPENHAPTNPLFNVVIKTEIFSLSAPIVLDPVDFTKKGLAQLVELWSLNASSVQHYLTASVSGPCLASARLVDIESLCYRHLAFEFSAVRIAEWSSDQKQDIEVQVKHGVVDWEKTKDLVSDEEFAECLKRFMVCLMCGTTITTAQEILLSCDFRLARSKFGDLLALVNKTELSITGTEYMLVSRGLHDFEGIHIAPCHLVGSRYRVVGRTWIPKNSLNLDVASSMAATYLHLNC